MNGYESDTSIASTEREGDEGEKKYVRLKTRQKSNWLANFSTLCYFLCWFDTPEKKNRDQKKDGTSFALQMRNRSSRERRKIFLELCVDPKYCG